MPTKNEKTLESLKDLAESLLNQPPPISTPEETAEEKLAPLLVLIEEISKGLASQDAEENVLAEHRIVFLKKQAAIVEAARAMPDPNQEWRKKFQALEVQKTAIINPALILDRDIVFTAEGVPEVDRDLQLQQVGIDLRLAKASKVVGAAQLTVDPAKIHKPSIIPLQLQNNTYFFKAGELYSIDFMEDVNVPDNMAGLVLHRSTINRTIGQIQSGWFDPGFQSAGGCGAVFRPNTDVTIEVGFRCAQIVFYSASSASSYAGQYQKT